MLKIYMKLLLGLVRKEKLDISYPRVVERHSICA